MRKQRTGAPSAHCALGGNSEMAVRNLNADALRRALALRRRVAEHAHAASMPGPPVLSAPASVGDSVPVSALAATQGGAREVAANVPIKQKLYSRARPHV